MDLDPQIAENIVTNLKDIIQHEINLFDTTGTIIASTDPARVGVSHDGARLVISTRKPITIDSEHEYKGAKHGINVPVLFDDAVVAVIGITGERSEVEPFGNVIKKMTEILIRESWEQITRFDQRTKLGDLMNLLTLRTHDEGMVSYLASVLKINLKLPRRVVAARLVATDDRIPDYDGLYRILYSRVPNSGGSFFAVTAQRACLFVSEHDERGLNKMLQGIETDVRARLRQEILFGVGDMANSSEDYWRSHDEACRAADWLMFTHRGSVGRYENMDFGLLLSSVSAQEARSLVDRVFGDLPKAQVDGFQTVFAAYTRHNGSITHAAEELFLHKNTLQNRLNKIAEKTGYNPRVLSDFTVLDIAFRLREYLEFEREGALLSHLRS